MTYVPPAALAAEALSIAEDVQAVASNPLHLPGRAGGVGSLALAVELLAKAVAALAAERAA